jgi:hypothetical protein
LRKLLKIGVPILIMLLMLVVVGTGVVFAKNQSTSVSTQTVAADAGYSNGGWGYCQGSCGWGGWNGGNSENYPPCHGYWR